MCKQLGLRSSCMLLGSFPTVGLPYPILKEWFSFALLYFYFAMFVIS